jgi:hypothetical protein
MRFVPAGTGAGWDGTTLCTRPQLLRASFLEPTADRQPTAPPPPRRAPSHANLLTRMMPPLHMRAPAGDIECLAEAARSSSHGFDGLDMYDDEGQTAL